MKKFFALLGILFQAFTILFAQTVNHQYQDKRYPEGLTILEKESKGLSLGFSMESFSVSPLMINGEVLDEIILSGVFLPGEAGKPNLPSLSRYILIPPGASVDYAVKFARVDTIRGLSIAPAPDIPLETEDGLHYEKDPLVYESDAYSPTEMIQLKQDIRMRGMDVVLIGISPFRYNPVKKELLVYRDLQIDLTFTGGSKSQSDHRYRSRWWDPILKQNLLNPEDLPPVDYSVHTKGAGAKTPDYEYIIICPDNASFLSWADSIKTFRTQQGIRTGIITTTDIGGNSSTLIEQYIDNAYNTWSVPPVAVLILGDYGTSGSSVESPIYDSYCASDNIYADVDNDDLPDIVFARITAQNATHLSTMIGRMLNYERNPPTNPAFYNNPITAMGWQTERWFQICSEAINGFFEYELGKSPVRENAIYSGTPGSLWSTATNTAAVVNYFGPSGTGYIPSTSAHLTDWGGNATRLNTDMNSGAFVLQHRDHGWTGGWGEPSYNTGSLSGLSGNAPTFIFSVNCLTGKFNHSSTSFAEAFHRQSNGCLGLIAATEVSYSFVNDAFTWGMYDYMWPQFMPSYGSPGLPDIKPAFANAAGKYFLQQSSWPYNSGNKAVTYHLFHHHGGAFSTVYSEMPQSLTVAHAFTMLAGSTSFAVTADSGSFIALSHNGSILGTADGTGMSVNITIPSQNSGDTVLVTVTRQNYYRYTAKVAVIPPSGPYVNLSTVSVNDGPAGNSTADYGETFTLDMTLQNVGSAAASNVQAVISCSHPKVQVLSNSYSFGGISSGASANATAVFSIKLAEDVDDGALLLFTLDISSGSNHWNDNFTLIAHSPELGIDPVTVDDASGNGNAMLDAGENAGIIVPLHNNGSASAYGLQASLNTTDPYISILNGSSSLGSLGPANAGYMTFSVQASPATPAGHMATFIVTVQGDSSVYHQDSFNLRVGQVPVLLLNFDPNNNSAPAMESALNALGVSFVSATAFPADLNLYASVFVCLGIYSSNHILTQSEGQLLSDYLNAGGKLYMEGGDTWYYDTQTPVHPLFSVNAVSDGSADLNTLNGESGTFTDGMSFVYGGDNSWIDRISPSGTAFTIFTNASPVYGSGIAYDAGTYKTIACSHEFGGLTDGIFPSSKEELMWQYLHFFGIVHNLLLADFIVSDNQPCAGSSIQFSDQSIGTITSWQWSFPGGTPSSSSLENPSVTYAQAGSYDVSLTVSDGMNSDQKSVQGMISVNAAPAQPQSISGSSPVCAEEQHLVYSIPPVNGANQYQWTVPNGFVIENGSGSTSLTLTAGQNGGSLCVKAVNSCGNSPDQCLPILVNNPPLLTQHPQNEQSTEGDTVQFQVAGNHIKNYNWQLSTNGGQSWANLTDGGNISGAQSSILQIYGVEIQQDGHQFRCICSGDCNPSVTSGAASLSVDVFCYPPSLTLPSSISVCSGEDADLHQTDAQHYVSLLWTSSGDGSFSNNTVLKPIYTPGSQDIQLGSVTLQLTATATAPCQDSSGSIQLLIHSLPLAFNLSGAGQFCASGNVSLTLDGSEYGVEYSLYRDGILLPQTYAGNGSSLSFNVGNQAGTYTLLARNTASACAQWMNGSPEVIIQPDIHITHPPTSQTVEAGTSLSFSVSASGTINAYQWQIRLPGQLHFSNLPDNATYNGSTSNMLMISSAKLQMNGTGYRCVIYGSCPDSVITQEVLLSVNFPGNPPQVEAGPDTVMCGLQAYSAIFANQQQCDSVWWTSTGAGTITNPAQLQTTYQPHSNDIGASGLYLLLNGYSSSTGIHVKDSLLLSYISLPQAFSLSGGGGYCPGETPADLILSGSEPGMEYQVFRDGSWTGNSIAGTGMALSYSPTQNGAYLLTAVDPVHSCSADMQDVVSIYEYPQPYADLGPDQVLQGATAIALDPGAFVSYQWSTGASTQSIQVNTPGTYWVEVTDANACLDSDTIIVSKGKVISGKLHYALCPNFILNGVLITLSDSLGNLIDSSYSQADGTYILFPNYSGLAKLSAKYNAPWVWGAANATDALKIMKQFVGLESFVPIQKRAGDVDLSFYLNGTDAFLIQKRYIGLINSFNSGDWVFEEHTIDLGNTPIVEQDLCGLLSGDVNASYGGATKQFPELMLLGANTALRHSQISLHAPEGCLVQAVSATIEVDKPELIIRDINIEGSQYPVLFKQSGNTISLSWADPNGLFSDANTPLFILETNGASSSIQNHIRLRDLDISSNSSSASLGYRLPENMESQLSIYPNPFEEELSIAIPSENNEEAVFELFDTDGSLVYQEILHLTSGINRKDIGFGAQHSAGWYQWRIITNEDVFTGKILKVKR